MKLMIQRSVVPTARPSRNNCVTGTPCSDFSGTTYSVVEVAGMVGSMRFSHLAECGGVFPAECKEFQRLRQEEKHHRSR